MNIAIVGASASGKTWLADKLSGHLSQHGVVDAPPLMRVVSGAPQLAPLDLQTLLDRHRTHFELTLLMGLDLPCTGDLQARQQSDDARLRTTLQQAGIPFGVVYGNGPDRLRHALRLITPQDEAPVRWRGVCEKCADPDCELRLFTELQRSKAAAHPAP